MILRCHIAAFLGGFLLDLLIGDPPALPHPVRLIGRLVETLEKAWNLPEDPPEKKRRRGRAMTALCMIAAGGCSAALLAAAYLWHPLAGLALELFMTCQILALKDLRDESMKVFYALEAGDIAKARHDLSMIVGRDTQTLAPEGIAMAAVETVAENLSDGVIAPLLYTALGGPAAGFVYKAVSTMDSMVGYRTKRFADFGRCAARMDDLLNFLPSRFSACLMIAACAFLGKDYDIRRAAAIWRRDAALHESPNAGQTESVCAGALGIRLGGPASYFGERKEKPYLGDRCRSAEAEDIRRAGRLLYASSFLAAALFFLCLLPAAL